MSDPMDIDETQEIKQEEKRNPLQYQRTKSAIKGRTHAFRVDGEGHRDLLSYLDHIKETQIHILESQIAEMGGAIKFQIACQVTMVKPGLEVDEKDDNQTNTTNFYSYVHTLLNVSATISY